MTSPNSLPVLRIAALVVPIPSVDDLPLPGKEFSHLLSFLLSIEIAFDKLLLEKDFLCSVSSSQTHAFPLLSYIRGLVLGTLRSGAVVSLRSLTKTHPPPPRSACFHPKP